MVASEIVDGLGMLKPKGKEPRNRSVLESWIVHAEAAVLGSQSRGIAEPLSFTPRPGPAHLIVRHGYVGHRRCVSSCQQSNACNARAAAHSFYLP